MRRINKLRILVFIASTTLTLSTHAVPLQCDPMLNCDGVETPRSAMVPSRYSEGSYGLSKGPEQQPGIQISGEQQARLIALMESQAADRYKIKQTARLAMVRLQQLAITEPYDEKQARELARAYGTALAELTLLDIEYANKIRQMLTPLQREVLQNSIDRSRKNIRPRL